MHVEQRGTTILAELFGHGISCEAFHTVAPDEQGQGAERAVNAHAVSTPKGDEIEAMVIDRVLRSVNDDSADKAFVSSTKGAIGYLLGAGVDA
jgi:3-oxoacyl-[acyl-carrier-protein] synthase II